MTSRLKIIIILLLCGVCNILQAQERKPWYEGIGVRAGIGIASMRGNVGFDESVVRFQAGISYEYKFTKHWGLETGIYLHTKGGADTRIEEMRRITTKMDLWYLQFPLVCNFHIPIGKFGIVPFAGFYVSHCLKGTVTAKALGDSSSWIDDNGKGKALRRFDAGMRLGCGFTYGHLSLSLGYDLGLSNIASKYYYYGMYKPSWKRHTGSFDITVGWTF